VEDESIDIDFDTATLKGMVERLVIIRKLNELSYPEKGNNTVVKKAKSYVNCAIGRMNES